MLAAHDFRWLPNTLTIARALLAVPIFWSALRGAWVLGFWLLLFALVTDFLDGLAAKKLNAQTKLGATLDVASDFVLAVSALAALVLSGHFPAWVALAMLAAACLIGYERWLWRGSSVVHQIRPMFSIVFLFATWALAAWGYATQAYGWHWWYVPLTILINLVLGLKKRHRMRAWFAYILQKRKAAPPSERGQ